MTPTATLSRPNRLPGLLLVVGLHVAVGYALVTGRKPVPPELPARVVATIVTEAPPPAPATPQPPAPPPEVQQRPSPPPDAPPPLPVQPAVPAPVLTEPAPAPTPAPAPSPAPAPAPAANPSPAPAPAAPAAAPVSTALSVVCPNHQRALGDAAFPQEAVRLGLDEGEVTVAFTVGPRGETQNVRALKASHGVFARAGVRLVAEYRCIGQGRDIPVEVPIRFIR